MSNQDDIITVEQIQGLPVIDDYSDLENEISEEARQLIAKTVLSSSAGLVTMSPLLCRGPTQCPFIERCPIYLADGNQGSYPISKQCIIEVNLVRQSFQQYAQELLNNHDRDVNKSPSLRAQVSKLAEFDLYEYRINLVLAGVVSGAESDGTMLLQQTIAITDEGAEIEQLQEHPIWRIKERIQKQRMDLLDAMGLTEKRKVMMDAALGKKNNESYLGTVVESLERLAAIVKE